MSAEQGQTYRTKASQESSVNGATGCWLRKQQANPAKQAPCDRRTGVASHRTWYSLLSRTSGSAVTVHDAGWFHYTQYTVQGSIVGYNSLPPFGRDTSRPSFYNREGRNRAVTSLFASELKSVVLVLDAFIYTKWPPNTSDWYASRGILHKPYCYERQKIPVASFMTFCRWLRLWSGGVAGPRSETAPGRLVTI